MISQTARPDVAPGTKKEACHAVMELCIALDEGRRIDPKQATKMARVLLGCYRARDFVDVDMFATALVATLAQYPAPIVAMVVDPIKGMPRRFKFPPSLAEVADELEALDKRVHLAWRGAVTALGYVRQ